MKAAGTACLVLLLVAFALTRAPAGTPLPPNPHQSLNAEGACGRCHAYVRAVLIPHEFVAPMPEKCWECHSQKDLGRSHPIGVDPSLSPPGVVEVPEELPLEDGKVSCGSCHNPHMNALSETQAFEKETPTFIQEVGAKEIPWYKTYFLRISDPVKGIEPLCMACHRDY